jgi:glycosyltransferase involved in cell wall biosynthesis
VKKVVILSGNHLCHNPRVHKEAATLATAGYDVEVLGAWWDPALAAEDVHLAEGEHFRYTPVVRLWGGAAALAARGERWAARLVQKYSGIELPSSLGYGTRRLLRTAQKRNADLYIAHSEPAIWVAAMLANSGKKVGIDMEDWFSEDLPTERRVGRPVGLLRSLEEKVLRCAAHSTCTSMAMSRALAAAYGCIPPKVLYNAFAWRDRDRVDRLAKDRNTKSMPSLHWFSQTLGPGRGLEDLVAALPLVSRPFAIHLRGNSSGDYAAWIRGQLPAEWSDRLFIHDLVPNDEILSRIVEHEIGFAGELKDCASRDLTVTNKVLHYLLGGLAVIASDTAGQVEIAERSGEAVRIYRAGDAASLASALNKLLASKESLDAARAAALEAARREFNWEQQAPVLLQSIRSALDAQV